jgi:hypothetical protein
MFRWENYDNGRETVDELFFAYDWRWEIDD